MPDAQPIRICRTTPVETYRIGTVDILVKRDDLMGNDRTLPPWGKLIGIEALVKQLDPNKPICHLNVFGSWSGWALSRIHRTAEVHVVHPKTKKISDVYLDRIRDARGVLHPIQHNMMRILYNQARSMAAANGWQMLPYAFDDRTYIESMRARVRNTLNALDDRIDDLVISSGSGVTVSGIAKEFLSYNPKGTVTTVCVSSERSVFGMMSNHGVASQAINVVKSPHDFGDTMVDVPAAPFPCNQFWDKKAWHWLTENIKTFRKRRILFWNLGGEYTY